MTCLDDPGRVSATADAQACRGARACTACSLERGFFTVGLLGASAKNSKSACNSKNLPGYGIPLRQAAVPSLKHCLERKFKQPRKRSVRKAYESVETWFVQCRRWARDLFLFADGCMPSAVPPVACMHLGEEIALCTELHTTTSCDLLVRTETRVLDTQKSTTAWHHRVGCRLVQRP